MTDLSQLDDYLSSDASPEDSARDGWKPLCDFLGVEVPDEPYPKTNPRAEFFAAARAGTEVPAN